MSFAETFKNDKAKLGIEIVANRLRKARVLDDELGDFFRERAQIEDHYSKQLLKLTKKVCISDKASLGLLTTQWEQIAADLQTIASMHLALSQSIIKNVERPLRESTIVPIESLNLRSMEANALKLKKEFEDKSIKLSKLQKMAEKSKFRRNDGAAQKVADMSQNIREVQNALDAEAARYYEQSERVDLTRLENIKRSLNAYSSSQTQSYQKNMESCEQTHNVINLFSAKDHINDFCANIHKHQISSNSSGLLSSKIDTASSSSGFGYWILRPRKNTTLNITQMFPIPAANESASSLSKAESLDRSSNLDLTPASVSNTIPPPMPVDEEGYSIPPAEHKDLTEYASSFDKDSINDNQENDNNGDYQSDHSSFLQPQKVMFDIKDQDEAITENPEDAAKALSNISNALKMQSSSMSPPPSSSVGSHSKRQVRGRRDKDRSTDSAIDPTKPSSQKSHDSAHSSSMHVIDRPFSTASEPTTTNIHPSINNNNNLHSPSNPSSLSSVIRPVSDYATRPETRFLPTSESSTTMPNSSVSKPPLRTHPTISVYSRQEETVDVKLVPTKTEAKNESENENEINQNHYRLIVTGKIYLSINPYAHDSNISNLKFKLHYPSASSTKEVQFHINQKYLQSLSSNDDVMFSIHPGRLYQIRGRVFCAVQYQTIISLLHQKLPLTIKSFWHPDNNSDDDITKPNQFYVACSSDNKDKNLKLSNLQLYAVINQAESDNKTTHQIQTYPPANVFQNSSSSTPKANQILYWKNPSSANHEIRVVGKTDLNNHQLAFFIGFSYTSNQSLSDVCLSILDNDGEELDDNNQVDQLRCLIKSGSYLINVNNQSPSTTITTNDDEGDNQGEAQDSHEQSDQLHSNCNDNNSSPGKHSTTGSDHINSPQDTCPNDLVAPLPEDDTSEPSKENIISNDQAIHKASNTETLAQSKDII